MLNLLKKYLLAVLVILGFSIYYYTYQVAPEIKLQDLTFNHLDSSPYTQEELKDKYVFLNVIATWCGPCIAELPSIHKANLLLEKENFKFLVVSDESLSLLQKFSKRHPISATYLQMQNNRKSLGIHTIPTSYLFGPNGELLLKKTNSMEWDSPENIQLLRDLANAN